MSKAASTKQQTGLPFTRRQQEQILNNTCSSLKQQHSRLAFSAPQLVPVSACNDWLQYGNRVHADWSPPCREAYEEGFASIPCTAAHNSSKILFSNAFTHHIAQSFRSWRLLQWDESVFGQTLYSQLADIWIDMETQ